MADTDPRDLPPVVVKLVWEPGPVHYGCRIFMGRDGNHLALCGELRMRTEEAVRFRGTVKQGINQFGCTGSLEAGWRDPSEPIGARVGRA